MNPKILTSFAILAIVAINKVSGRSCTGCGFGAGADYCAPCLPSTYGAKSVQPTGFKCGQPKPIGDMCHCEDVIVKPVSIPRPKCVYKHKKPHVPRDNRPLIPAPDHLHDFSQDVDTYDNYDNYDNSYMGQTDSSCGGRPLYPVDAVSISLVNRLQDSLAQSVPEERLQYGFYKIPKDVPVYRQIVNVPEEKLFTVERQIVELKNPKQIVKVNHGGDEEIIMEDRETQPIAYLSYSDLGYVPEQASNPTFVTSSCNRKCRPSKYHDEVEIIEDSSEEDYKYKSKSCGGCKKIQCSE